MHFPKMLNYRDQCLQCTPLVIVTLVKLNSIQYVSQSVRVNMTPLGVHTGTTLKLREHDSFRSNQAYSIVILYQNVPPTLFTLNR